MDFMTEEELKEERYRVHHELLREQDELIRKTLIQRAGAECEWDLRELAITGRVTMITRGLDPFTYLSLDGEDILKFRHRFTCEDYQLIGHIDYKEIGDWRLQLSSS